VLDRHPSLRLIGAAGGGGLAALAGRLDAGYRVPELAGAALGPPGAAPAATDEGPTPARPPSSYLKQVYVDTLMFSEPALRCALDVFGPSQLLFGTDWPPVAIPAAVSRELIDRAGLSEDVRAGILGGNAAAMFGWPAAG
jgi:aminocarboxymuconate-semialdehyde decarboxylase